MAKRNSSISNTTPAVNTLTSLSNDAINARPKDDIDMFIADMDSKEAIISCEDMDAIEARWNAERINRRAALIMLTKPFKWLSETTGTDKDFAEAVANIHEVTKDLAFYKGMVELLECAHTWTMIALCSREDMQEIKAAERVSTTRAA